MSRVRFINFAIALCTSVAVVFAGAGEKPAYARGGHGGGHHGGGHHGHHPYHPSHHHTAHHNHHHDQHHYHHYHHHHHSWHHGGWWGPGFWGGLGLGAGLGWYGGNYWGGGYGGYGGDTYIDNASNASTDGSTQSTTNTANTAADSNQQAQQGAAANGFPVDDWPELGVVTYAGQYGKTQGMVVVRVVPNSAAARAGMVPGDVIQKLNGQPTPSADALESALNGAKGKFDATVWDARTGRTSTLTGSLDAAPADLSDDADGAPAIPTSPAAR